MKVRVALVTKVDVVATADDGQTYTFKLADNPLLQGIKVGDDIFIEADSVVRVDVKPTTSDQLANEVRKAKEQAPSGSRGCASNHRKSLEFM